MSEAKAMYQVVTDIVSFKYGLFIFAKSIYVIMENVANHHLHLQSQNGIYVTFHLHLQSQNGIYVTFHLHLQSQNGIYVTFHFPKYTTLEI